MLRAGRDFHSYIAIKRLNWYISSQYSLTDCNKQFCVNVWAFAFEVGMWFDFYVYYQVTSWCTDSSMTLFRYSQIDPVINSLWNAYIFLDLTVVSASSSTCYTRAFNDLAYTIAVSADLLNHERTLTNRLESLSSTPTTRWRWRAWLWFATFTRLTNICPAKADRLCCSVYCIHEFYLNIHNNVLTFCLYVSSRSTTTITASKHALKLLEYIAEACWSLELFWKSFKSAESCRSSERVSSTSEWVLASKRVLRLLITSHSSLIVHLSFAFIWQRFVRVVYCCKLFFRFWCLVHIWMVLFGEFKVFLFYICLWSVPRHFQGFIKVLFAAGWEASLKGSLWDYLPL